MRKSTGIKVRIDFNLESCLMLWYVTNGVLPVEVDGGGWWGVVVARGQYIIHHTRRMRRETKMGFENKRTSGGISTQN